VKRNPDNSTKTNWYSIGAIQFVEPNSRELRNILRIPSLIDISIARTGFIDQHLQGIDQCN